MLKDVTLGQYFPGNSIIHRLDPRVKIIWLVGYIVALFLVKGWGGYALVAALLVTVTAVARIGAKAMLKGMKPLVFIVVFTGLINLFYGSGEPLVEFWVFKITANGIRNAIFMVLRILLLGVGLVSLLGGLLRIRLLLIPLGIAGLAVRALGVGLLIAARAGLLVAALLIRILALCILRRGRLTGRRLLPPLRRISIGRITVIHP